MGVCFNPPLRANGEPLFSSHMLDLSEEFDEENIATCVKYFKRMAAVKLWLEMEIGITGGEEVGRGPFPEREIWSVPLISLSRMEC